MTRNDSGMKLEARGIKSFLGREGHGFNATLYINGKKAAFVMDSANGGTYDWRWFNKEAEAKFDAYVATLPLETFDGYTMKPDADMVMGKLVDDALHARRLARLMKTKTVFRLKYDLPGEWHTLSGGFSPAAKEWLVKKYGDNLGEILNERKS